MRNQRGAFSRDLRPGTIVEPGGVTPVELSHLRRLFNEFRPEIEGLGEDTRKIETWFHELQHLLDSLRVALTVPQLRK
jgi:hypothetical protein